MVEFGWFETDGKTSRTIETYKELPFYWQNLREPHERQPFYSFEAVMPLENEASLWLFADLEYGYWKVQATLWIPCPIHNKGLYPSERNGVGGCQYAAIWARQGEVVTQPDNCAGVYCPGCSHYPVLPDVQINGDPGDEQEFWELARFWSSLEIVPGKVAEHEHIED